MWEGGKVGGGGDKLSGRRVSRLLVEYLVSQPLQYVHISSTSGFACFSYFPLICLGEWTSNTRKLSVQKSD